MSKPVSSVHSWFAPVAIFLGLTCATLAAPTDPAGAVPPTTPINGHPNVMILNSYHSGFQWTDQQVNGLQDYFSSTLPQANLFVEYLDTKRFNRRDVWKKMLEIALSKYPPGFLDLIIVTDDNAYQVLLAGHDKLGNIPAVFCGINYFDPEPLKTHPNITGILERLDFEGTWTLACDLMNRPYKKVAVIVDNTPTGEAYRKDAQRWFNTRTDLTPVWLDGRELTHARLIERLKAMGPDTLVIMGVWLRDADSTYLATEKYYPQVAAAAPGPVFTVVDIGLDCNLAGGCVLDGYTHGQAAAAIAVDVLNGADITAMEVSAPATSKISLDYRVFKQWGVDLDQQVGWIVRNRPVSFYQANRGMIWTAVIVILVESTLILLLIVNIVRRRQAARQLSEAYRTLGEREEDLRITLKSIGDAVISTDCDGRVMQMNHVAEKLTGWSAEEARGKPMRHVFNIVNSITREPVDNPVGLVLRTGAIQGLANHTVLIARDGAEYQIADSAAPILDVDGRMAGVVLTFRDVTSDYEKDRLLRESQQRSELVLAHTGEIITYVDRELRVKWTNYRSNDGEVAAVGPDGRTLCCYELLFGLEGRCDDCTVLQAIESGQDTIHEMKSADGRIFQVHSTPVRDDAGSVIGAVETARDITEQHSLAQQLIHSDRMNAIGRLAGGIAHDFNNLLQVILGYGELLESDGLDDGQRKNLASIMDAGCKARNLVRQMLIFSRKREIAPEVVEPGAILDGTLTMLRPLVGENISLDVAPYQGDRRVLADPEQIQQVLINICINARDAMDGAGAIGLTLDEIDLDAEQSARLGVNGSGRYLRFAVTDTGEGIADGDMAHIFEPFYTTKQTGKGSGLGLSTAYAIVQRHGGCIRAANRPEGGAVFEILLPATDIDPTRPTPGGKADDQRRERRRGRVLLAEDEEMVRRYTTRLLESMGFEVVAAENGQKAVELFSREPQDYCMIILDAMMPVMNGPQAGRKIHALRPDIPVLFATGYSRELLEGDFLLKTPGKLLQKPFSVEQLTEAIDQMLDDK